MYFKENDTAHRKKVRCPSALGVFGYTPCKLRT